MKHLSSLLAVLALLVLSSISTFAQNTNKTVMEQVTATAKQTVATNLNQLMIEVLQGVKVEGGEVYKASKQAVGQAYEFVKKEAPEVVEEFLKWQITKAIIWTCVWVSVAFVLFYFGRRMSNFLKNSDNHGGDAEDLACVFSWVFRIATIAIIIITLGIHAMTIAEIVVAPRVYIIEYVVDALQPQTK
jgi:hypothetical protein